MTIDEGVGERVVRLVISVISGSCSVCVCVRACVRACVCAYALVCVCVAWGRWVWVWVWVRVCAHTHARMHARTLWLQMCACTCMHARHAHTHKTPRRSECMHVRSGDLRRSSGSSRSWLPRPPSRQIGSVHTRRHHARIWCMHFMHLPVMHAWTHLMHAYGARMRDILHASYALYIYM